MTSRSNIALRVLVFSIYLIGIFAAAEYMLVNLFGLELESIDSTKGALVEKSILWFSTGEMQGGMFSLLAVAGFALYNLSGFIGLTYSFPSVRKSYEYSFPLALILVLVMITAMTGFNFALGLLYSAICIAGTIHGLLFWLLLKQLDKYLPMPAAAR